MTAAPDRLRLIARVNEALALAGDVLTFNDLVAMARERRVQVFANDEALIATELLTYPQARHLNCFVGAGSLAGMFALETQVEDFARQYGVTMMIAHGRPAWGRIGEARGWRADAIRYVKRMEIMQ